MDEKKDQKQREPISPLLQNLVKSALMAGFVLFSFTMIYRYLSELAIASLAASAFIALNFSKGEPSRPRTILGGYLCGVAGGLVCNLAMRFLQDHFSEPLYSSITFCALSVLITCFLMLSFRVLHPPAAALTISMVGQLHPLGMGAMVLLCVALLCGLQRVAFLLLDGYVQPPGAPPAPKAPGAEE